MEVLGAPIAFAVRPTTGTEEGVILERATEYAIARHAAKVESGNPLFDLGIMLHTLAIVCVDPDSPPDNREPFWDAGADQIANAMDTEQIAWLYAVFERWQDECSPTVRSMSGPALVQRLVDIAGADGDDARFFDGMRLGTLVILLRTTAKLLLTSPEGNSQLSSLLAQPATH